MVVGNGLKNSRITKTHTQLLSYSNVIPYYASFPVRLQEKKLDKPSKQGTKPDMEDQVAKLGSNKCTCKTWIWIKE